MKLKFLELPTEERRLYFQQAAIQKNISPVVLEKDFWVCFILGVLFQSEFADNLVFKGGTSLSKAHGVIERFSEDIDLSLSPSFLKLPDVGASRNQAHKWMVRAEEACGEAVNKKLRPLIESRIDAVLGNSNQSRLEFLIDVATHSPVLLFHYPTFMPTGFDYLKRSVKLEFGLLTDQRPAGRHPIRPWLSDIFPDALMDWKCEVVALELDRSYWEKATILHAEYHRPADKPTPDRFSRHYADMAGLAVHPKSKGAIDQHEIRDRVVKWKSLFFGSAWANYQAAKPGAFRLAPSAERISALRRDYHAMREMYLTEPIEFEEIIQILKRIENHINS